MLPKSEFMKITYKLQWVNTRVAIVEAWWRISLSDGLVSIRVFLKELLYFEADNVLKEGRRQMYRMKNQSSICKQQAAQSMTSPLSRLPLPVQGVAFHIWISTYLTLNKQYVRLSRRATLTKTPKIHSIIEKLHFSATVKISNPRNILSP